MSLSSRSLARTRRLVRSLIVVCSLCNALCDAASWWPWSRAPQTAWRFLTPAANGVWYDVDGGHSFLLDTRDTRAASLSVDEGGVDATSITAPLADDAKDSDDMETHTLLEPEMRVRVVLYAQKWWVFADKVQEMVVDVATVMKGQKISFIPTPKHLISTKKLHPNEANSAALKPSVPRDKQRVFLKVYSVQDGTLLAKSETFKWLHVGPVGAQSPWQYVEPNVIVNYLKSGMPEILFSASSRGCPDLNGTTVELQPLGYTGRNPIFAETPSCTDYLRVSNFYHLEDGWYVAQVLQRRWFPGKERRIFRSAPFYLSRFSRELFRAIEDKNLARSVISRCTLTDGDFCARRLFHEAKEELRNQMKPDLMEFVFKRSLPDASQRLGKMIIEDVANDSSPTGRLCVDMLFRYYVPAHDDKQAQDALRVFQILKNKDVEFARFFFSRYGLTYKEALNLMKALRGGSDPVAIITLISMLPDIQDISVFNGLWNSVALMPDSLHKADAFVALYLRVSSETLLTDLETVSLLFDLNATLAQLRRIDPETVPVLPARSRTLPQ